MLYKINYRATYGYEIGKQLQVKEQQIWQTLDSLYAAALSPDKWQEALRSVMSLSDCITAVYLLFDLETCLCPKYEIVNEQTAFIEKYTAEYAQYDPRLQFILENPDITLFYDDLYSTSHQKLMSDYYNWEKGYFGEFINVHGAQLIRTETHQAVVAFARPEKAGCLKKEDMEVFARLIPHMRKALVLNQILNQKSVADTIRLSSYSESTHAIIVLDQMGMPIYLNTKAEKIIALQDAFHIKQGKLGLIRHTDHLKYDQLLARVNSFHSKSCFVGDGEMIVLRKSGLRPYYLNVLPFQLSSGPTIIQAPSTLVIIRDPENECIVEQGVFRYYFDLSRQEARVVALLVKGGDIKSIAETLGLKIETVRSYMKQVFRKTKTRGQLELIRLLLKLQ